MGRASRIAVAAVLVLALAVGVAQAAQPRFSMSEIEAELMCPTCQTRLDMSHSPAADRIRAYVEEKRRLGWTKQQVEDALVREFGPAVLAAPPAAGLGLAAWLAPLAVVVGGAAVAVALVLAWRRRRPAADGAEPVDEALAARVDEALADLGDDG